MQVRILGCSGSIAQHDRTTSFLIDGRLLIDAGTGVGDLSLDEMAQIDHIVVTHSHLDHILSIPLLADSVMKRRLSSPSAGPIRVHGLPETLTALKAHVFNNVIWPDFTRIPTVDRPILALCPVHIGQVIELGGQRVEILPARHTVPACGVAVDSDQGWWVYTGDTGPNPELWAVLNGRRIAQLVIETAFSDEERALAEVSRHLCPSLLVEELRQLLALPPIAITHVKPGEMSAVMGQLGARAPSELRALRRGDTFQF